jgi:hypothetical protein
MGHPHPSPPNLKRVTMEWVYLGHPPTRPSMQLITQMSRSVIIAGCLMASAAVLANMISLMMIGKINERVPESERISYFCWGKRFKLLYPGNRLVFLLDSCVVMIILCFIFLIRFWVFS